jgi:hypothetical protein
MRTSCLQGERAGEEGRSEDLLDQSTTPDISAHISVASEKSAQNERNSFLPPNSLESFHCIRIEILGPVNVYHLKVWMCGGVDRSMSTTCTT